MLCNLTPEILILVFTQTVNDFLGENMMVSFTFLGARAALYTFFFVTVQYRDFSICLYGRKETCQYVCYDALRKETSKVTNKLIVWKSHCRNYWGLMTSKVRLTCCSLKLSNCWSRCREQKTLILCLRSAARLKSLLVRVDLNGRMKHEARGSVCFELNAKSMWQ